ncbi:MAG: TraB/GumN family protein [Rhodanobacteraceae bacterium]|jgi:uncharacterized protein YbaP (TraB family)|nr:TraB/GumN family protein [Rhodanobacteraceae bacterium]
MRRVVLVVSFWLFGPITAFAAAEAPPADAPVADAAAMETVVVTGVQPGPGLWKVSKGDHVLWVLGTLSPLPKRMEWKSQEVEAVLAGAQEVLTEPEFRVTADVGFFGQLALLPSLVGVRNNPDGAKLRDVVAPDAYARWSALKERYIGRRDKVEKWRPIFAAAELYDAALDKIGLEKGKRVQKAVLAAAKRSGARTTPIRVTIEIADPRAAIKEFKHTALDDQECFRKTLDRIDIEVGSAATRANAWATADLEALRQLPRVEQIEACLAAVTETDLLRKRGVGDPRARAEALWLDAATSALERNAVSFAMLPIESLLARDNVLTQLAARGYALEAPDDAGAVGDAPAP